MSNADIANIPARVIKRMSPHNLLDTLLHDADERPSPQGLAHCNRKTLIHLVRKIQKSELRRQKSD